MIRNCFNSDMISDLRGQRVGFSLMLHLDRYGKGVWRALNQGHVVAGPALKALRQEIL
jgi:hypothetical protein